ncbi:hypothetical protein AVDCRST_MAG84-3907 [uncultured Microcoleus sp.]|uniref:Uncharacterized protein n=1 Tax=uncultured Microcoleus sp. TaxID=259945 RepID=A0A6J4MU46_9CYAN|nr:hypothetical protein AVDCRST_MAG84-3907 [uncultured Microcoleus sp.]
MSKQCSFSVGDKVRPRTAKPESVWEVIEVCELGFSLTASKLTLEPGEEWHTATGPVNKFISIKSEDN